MCDGAELKDAVYGYVSALNSYSDTPRLNYINSQIIPYSGSLKSFVRDLTPQHFHRSGGNTGNSDISDVLEKIPANLGDDVVSIFVSDCIRFDDGNFFYRLNQFCTGLPITIFLLDVNDKVITMGDPINDSAIRNQFWNIMANATK